MRKTKKLMELLELVKDLENSDVKNVVDKKLKGFASFKNKDNDEWFSELCFCILTANSKASTAIMIQEELCAEGFLNGSQEMISKCIRSNGHRFHNNKSRFIVGAREYRKIKDIVGKLIKDGEEPRNYIAETIKGIGYKEASHFLRNVGFTNYAILDRHILNIMVDYGILKEKPKTLTKKMYFEIEEIFREMARLAEMNCAELDFYLWYLKTDTILK